MGVMWPWIYLWLAILFGHCGYVLCVFYGITINVKCHGFWCLSTRLYGIENLLVCASLNRPSVSLNEHFIGSNQVTWLNLYLGTAGIQEIKAQYPLLSSTAAGVLTCALNLPKTNIRGEELKYTIYTNNPFTGYPLYSILREHGIGACGTARSDRFGTFFENEINPKKNGKILAWGEVRTHVETANK